MLKKTLLYLFLLVSYMHSLGQCAMCKAGAEQSLERGSTAVHWINYAIIFLMTIPLLLIFCLYRLYKFNQNKGSNSN